MEISQAVELFLQIVNHQNTTAVLALTTIVFVYLFCGERKNLNEEREKVWKMIARYEEGKLTDHEFMLAVIDSYKNTYKNPYSNSDNKATYSEHSDENIK